MAINKTFLTIFLLVFLILSSVSSSSSSHSHERSAAASNRSISCHGDQNGDILGHEDCLDDDHDDDDDHHRHLLQDKDHEDDHDQEDQDQEEHEEINEDQLYMDQAAQMDPGSSSDMNQDDHGGLQDSYEQQTGGGGDDEQGHESDLDSTQSAGDQSMTTRRVLYGWTQGARYISYGALKKDRVPCNQRGQSYYNCKRGGRANPYRRGCSVITNCARILN